MPITRKVIEVGNSKMVSIPKTWLENIEEKRGEEIEEIQMEVNSILKIFPKGRGKNES